MVLPKDFIHYQNHSKATKKAIDNLKKCSNNLIEFKITDINKQTHRNDFFSKI
jgi:hypothetical protein